MKRRPTASNYDRLVALKTKVDPDNLFRLNANIAPKAREPSGASADERRQATAARIGLSGTSTSSMAWMTPLVARMSDCTIVAPLMWIALPCKRGAQRPAFHRLELARQDVVGGFHARHHVIAEKRLERARVLEQRIERARGQALEGRVGGRKYRVLAGRAQHVDERCRLERAQQRLEIAGFRRGVDEIFHRSLVCDCLFIAAVCAETGRNRRRRKKPKSTATGPRARRFAPHARAAPV